jgi:hypothetical protein
MRKIVLLALAAFLLGLGACGGENTEETTSAETIVYSEGFFNLERDGDISWRWMEPEGVVKLKNTGRDMTLRITGRPPVEQLKNTPRIKIALNGATLEEIEGSSETLNKEYTITPAQQGVGEWSELRITSDSYFVPKNVDKNSPDERRLAFSITGLSWQPK